MDFSEPIQREITKAGQKLTEIGEKLDKINRNPNIDGMEEHQKQEDCVTEALAYCYKLYNYVCGSTLTSTESSKLSENAQRIAEKL